MRIYSVQYGKFPGEYEIYDNPEEFIQHHPTKTFLRWKRDPVNDHVTIKAGDWVEAQDGFVCMCLDKYEVNTGMRGSIRIRFPMSTIRVYYTKSEGWKVQQFYAMYTFPGRGVKAAEYVSIFREVQDPQLRAFVALLIGGGDPLKALYAVYFNARNNLNTGPVGKAKTGEQTPGDGMWFKLLELLNHKKIKSIIMEALSNFGTVLEKEFPAESLLNDLKILYDSTKNERLKFDMIKWIGEQQGYTKKLTAGGKQAYLPGDNGKRIPATMEVYPQEISNE